MASIVVPLDTSPLAEEALPWAAKLASVRGEPVHLVVVWDQDHRLLELPVSTPRPEVFARVGEYLDRLAGSADLEGVAVSTEIREADDVTRAIADVCAERDASLAVIKSHGRGGLSRIFLGSVAARLVRTLDIPLLVDRRGGVQPALHRLLVTLDGSPDGETALGPARELAAAAGAEIVLLTVYSEHPETHIAQYEGVDFLGAHIEEVHEAAEAYMRGVAEPGERWEARAGRPLDVIVQFAHDEGCDVIVMATHGRGGVVRLALGSVADGVMRAANRPVLYVPVRPPDAED